MAALSVYQQHIDKENTTGGVGRKALLKPGHSSFKAQEEKVFMTKTLKDGSTSVRRVLGDVNRSHQPKMEQTRPMKPVLGAPRQPMMQPPQPAHKPSRPKAEKPKVTVKPSLPKEVASIKCFVDEIEKMHILDNNEEDGFEVIWPAAQRPATYLEPLKEWRQWPGLFTMDSDEEEEEDRLSDDEDSDPFKVLTEHSYEEPDLGERFGRMFPVLALEDLPLPSYEEIFQCSSGLLDS